MKSWEKNLSFKIPAQNPVTHISTQIAFHKALVALDRQLNAVQGDSKRVFWPKHEPLPNSSIRKMLTKHYREHGWSIYFYLKRRDGGFVTATRFEKSS